MREGDRRRFTNRRAIAAAVAIASVVAFASLGGSIAIANAQNPPGNKVTICHKGKNTITISLKAWPAHQRHGDTLGSCLNGHKPNNGKHNGNANHGANPGNGASTQSSTTGQTSHGNGKANGHG